MQITDALKSRTPRGAKAAYTGVFACWVLGALLFAALPAGSGGRYLVAVSYTHLTLPTNREV